MKGIFQHPIHFFSYLPSFQIASCIGTMLLVTIPLAPNIVDRILIDGYLHNIVWLLTYFVIVINDIQAINVGQKDIFQRMTNLKKYAFYWIQCYGKNAIGCFVKYTIRHSRFNAWTQNSFCSYLSHVIHTKVLTYYYTRVLTVEKNVKKNIQQLVCIIGRRWLAQLGVSQIRRSPVTKVKRRKKNVFLDKDRAVNKSHSFIKININAKKF